MLHIEWNESGCLRLSGRFDAAQVAKADPVFDAIDASCVVDFEGLSYISSAGLGVLLGTQQRLGARNHSLTLVNLESHVKNVFLCAGFDQVFAIR